MSETLTKRERKARIRRGQPIEALGLQFYPITMADYEEFLECKSVWALRMTSLAKQSFEYITMPFLAALWAVDYDTARATGKPVGMTWRVLMLLCLSLRLGHEEQDKLLLHGVYCDRSTPRSLRYIEVTQDGKTAQISPVDFTTTVRPLIAEQNGIELPDESQNPDILQTEQLMQEEQASKIKFDLKTMIASVASASHVRQRDIDDWTVMEFETQKQALDRKINYMVFTQAEMSGMVKFPRGNPYPSWCFDRADTLTNALITVDEMQNKYKGVGDVKQTVQQGSQE